ncbi:MAG TPA: hypothetical protein VHX60_01570 [Acidobacteriaceae bacterium]|nr:hypothetical protein [Acidobacteriaceae bacterium]
MGALLAGLFATAWQASIPNPLPTTERIESGELQAAGGDIETYRIRLLPVASFPDLPQAVASQLTRRGCMIPQSFEAQQPENVIHGSFRAAGSSDWAALCSIDSSTTLYVFLAGQFGNPITVRSQPDTQWLGADPGNSIFGSSWGIAVRSAANLRASHQLHGAATYDHDGIEDARLERSATVRYWDDGHWLVLDARD